MKNRMRFQSDWKRSRGNPYYGFALNEQPKLRVYTDPTNYKVLANRPSDQRCKTKYSSVDQNPSLELSYTETNKNVSIFRDVMETTNNQYLPFLNSLRKFPQPKHKIDASSSTPYQTANKTTCNMKIRKRVSDFKWNNGKVSSYGVEWHKAGTKGLRELTDYLCQLRQYTSDKRIKHEKHFDYTNTHYNHPFQLSMDYRVPSQQDQLCNKHRK